MGSGDIGAGFVPVNTVKLNDPNTNPVGFYNNQGVLAQKSGQGLQAALDFAMATKLGASGVPTPSVSGPMPTMLQGGISNDPTPQYSAGVPQSAPIRTQVQTANPTALSSSTAASGGGNAQANVNISNPRGFAPSPFNLNPPQPLTQAPLNSLPGFSAPSLVQPQAQAPQGQAAPNAPGAQYGNQQAPGGQGPANWNQSGGSPSPVQRSNGGAPAQPGPFAARTGGGGGSLPQGLPQAMAGGSSLGSGHPRTLGGGYAVANKPQEKNPEMPFFTPPPPPLTELEKLAKQAGVPPEEMRRRASSSGLDLGAATSSMKPGGKRLAPGAAMKQAQEATKDIHQPKEKRDAFKIDHKPTPNIKIPLPPAETLVPPPPPTVPTGSTLNPNFDAIHTDISSKPSPKLDQGSTEAIKALLLQGELEKDEYLANSESKLNKMEATRDSAMTQVTNALKALEDFNRNKKPDFNKEAHDKTANALGYGIGPDSPSLQRKAEEMVANIQSDFRKRHSLGMPGLPFRIAMPSGEHLNLNTSEIEKAKANLLRQYEEHQSREFNQIYTQYEAQNRDQRDSLNTVLEQSAKIHNNLAKEYEDAKLERIKRLSEMDKNIEIQGDTLNQNFANKTAMEREDLRSSVKMYMAQMAAKVKSEGITTKASSEYNKQLLEGYKSNARLQLQDTKLGIDEARVHAMANLALDRQAAMDQKNKIAADLATDKIRHELEQEALGQINADARDRFSKAAEFRAQYMKNLGEGKLSVAQQKVDIERYQKMLNTSDTVRKWVGESAGVAREMRMWGATQATMAHASNRVGMPAPIPATLTDAIIQSAAFQGLLKSILSGL